MAECIDLESLLVPTFGLTNPNVEREARENYAAYYVDAPDGTHRTHDGIPVVFFRDRFEHAFFRSFDFRANNGIKNEVDKLRCERIYWISPLIGGRLPESECLIVPNEREGRPDKRLYILNSECYIVWLEPLASGLWKFSSAYKPLAFEIKKYRRSAKATLCKF